MKKHLLAAGLGLLTTVAVTATVLNNHNKKTTKNTTKSCTQMQHQCSKKATVACY
jgi:hypothetical protein